MIWNPFKRTRYTVRTILSPEQCSRRILDTMNDYNQTARGRFVLATAFGERFSARIEPGSLGSRGSGNFMKHFVVEVAGSFQPALDGTVDVTIGFQRATSLVQLAWRLVVAACIASAVWTLEASPVIPIVATTSGAFFLPLLLLWSLVALVQGMWQAGKDWDNLHRFVQAALGSHAISRI